MAASRELGSERAPWQDPPVEVQVACGHCGQIVPGEDVDLAKMLAHCRKCGGLFDVSVQLAPTAAQPRQRELVAMPRGFRVTQGGAAVTAEAPTPYRQIAAAETASAAFVITRRWLSWRWLLFALLCVGWDVAIAVWYREAWATGSLTVGPIIHVIAGVGISYGAIAGLLNRTTIAARNGLLTVRHGPVPWPGAMDVPTSELAQLFCTERLLKSRNNTSRTYAVVAALRSGEKKLLVRDLPNPEQALFIEQTLERELGIVDVAVAGEY
jgi:hypothetical protein